MSKQVDIDQTKIAKPKFKGGVFSNQLLKKTE